MFSTVYTLQANTEAAQTWIDDHVQAEPWQMVGEAIVIGHRYIEPIVEALVEEGFRPEKDFAAQAAY